MKLRFVGFILITIFLFSNGFVLAQENNEYTLDDITWEGYITSNLDKEIFSSDEEITGYLIIENSEYQALIGQRIILQIGTGEYSYPSHLSNDNIIKEIVFEDEWVIPRKLKRLEFNLGTLPPGEYHLDVYSWILKSMFVGSNAILFNPVTTTFTVQGENNKQELFIERETTNFGENKIIGPVGFPVKPEQEFPGEIFITNNTNEQKNNLTLTIEICDWSSAFCTGDLFDSEQQKITKEINIPSVQPNQTIKVDTTLIAPQIPSAYEINMILKQNTEILSIYKNRVIVEGGTAKLRKIIFDGLSDRNYFLRVLIAGSPDHFTFPDFYDFEMKMSVYNEDSLINQQTKDFDKIQTGQVKGNDFYIEEKIFDKICVEITKQNLVYDKECFTVDIELLQKEYDKAYPEEMKIDYSYNEFNNTLRLELSKEILNKINARIRILKENNERLTDQTINQEGAVIREYNLEKQNYTLIIDDFDARKQKVIYLTLDDTNPTAFDESKLNECPGIVCPNATTCSIQTFNSNQGPCCLGDCVPATSSSGTLNINNLPLIFWIALILLIASIAILTNTLIKRRRQK